MPVNDNLTTSNLGYKLNEKECWYSWWILQACVIVRARQPVNIDSHLDKNELGWYVDQNEQYNQDRRDLLYDFDWCREEEWQAFYYRGWFR